MTLEITHKDRVITYSESENTWKCEALSLSAPSLSALRQQIDRFSTNERKVNVPALLITRRYRDDAPEAKAVTITILCEPEKNRYRSTPERIEQCWIRLPDGRRDKQHLHSLAPVSEGPAIKRWIEASQAASEAEKKARELLEAIPRLDADAVMLAHKEAEAAKAPKAKR